MVEQQLTNTNKKTTIFYAQKFKHLNKTPIGQNLLFFSETWEPLSVLSLTLGSWVSGWRGVGRAHTCWLPLDPRCWEGGLVSLSLSLAGSCRDWAVRQGGRRLVVFLPPARPCLSLPCLWLVALLSTDSCLSCCLRWCPHTS